jgi:hypothetical protein
MAPVTPASASRQLLPQRAPLKRLQDVDNIADHDSSRCSSFEHMSCKYVTVSTHQKPVHHIGCFAHGHLVLLLLLLLLLLMLLMLQCSDLNVPILAASRIAVS